MKEITGEPLEAAWHYNEMYMERGGARTSEDTTTLVHPRDIERFILPYLRRCFEPFGGGYVHFCGRHPEILRLLCETPEVRGVNFGNPERYEPAEVLPMLLERERSTAASDRPATGKTCRPTSGASSRPWRGAGRGSCYNCRAASSDGTRAPMK